MATSIRQLSCIKTIIILTFLAGTLFSSCSKNELVPEVQLQGKAALRTTIAATQITYEAEQAALNGAVVASNHPQYTGTGFVDYINTSGDFIEWTVNASNTGFFSLEFRYANGGPTNRALKLEVNGATILASVTFLPTSGWTNWSVFLSDANLIAGSNKIRLTATGSSGPNIDHLVVKDISTDPRTLEAELGVLSGAVIASNQPGFQGSGFVDYVNASTDFIEWTINTTTSASYLLNFRYANGSSINRPLQLKVNETTIANLAFAPTGSFAKWSFLPTTVNLIAGANKIRLTAIGSSGPNVDNLSYSVSIKHKLYMVDNGLNKLLFLNQKDPSTSWTIPIPSGSRDLQLIGASKILVSHGNGAAEYDRTTGAKGWSISTYSGVTTAQRLPNGNTMIGWSMPATATTPAKVLLSEVNSGGTEVSKVTVNNVTTFRLARRLSNGNTLLTGDLNGNMRFMVFEVDSSGTIVWQQLLYGGKGYVATRLANGETRASMAPVGALYEPGKDDNKVLQLSTTGSVIRYWGGMIEHPNAELRKFSGFSVVPGNGNIVVANWLGDGNIGTGPHAVEFDTNNKLVWSWKDFSAAQTVTNLLVVE